MAPKATTKSAKQPKGPGRGEAGPSKLEGKGKRKQVHSEDSDTDQQDDVDDVEAALNTKLKALGLARVDFTELKSVVNEMTAAQDDIGEQVAAAIWSYNILDLDDDKQDAIKFVNPWNSRPVDISKGQALKNSMIEQGRRPFLAVNHIYIIEDTDRFDPSCVKSTATELWKAPMLKLKAGDTKPVKIPGGGHRRWAVNRLLAQSRILRVQTLPLGITKAKKRLEEAENEDQMKKIEGEIASMEADLAKVEAEEVALGHWGVTVLDENKVSPELARKLARNVQDYQYVEQEQEMIINLLGELNLIRRTNRDVRASSNLAVKFKKYPSLETVFLTQQSFNFFNHLGGKKFNAEEELGDITKMYLQTPTIGTVKFLEKAFASDIAGIVATAARAMHDLIFQVLTTGDVATPAEYEAMVEKTHAWGQHQLTYDEKLVVVEKTTKMHGDILRLLPRGEFVEGFTPELLDLIANVNADLYSLDSLPFGLLDEDHQRQMNIYGNELQEVWETYFEGKTPSLKGEDRWTEQRKKMHRKVTYMTTEQPGLPHCPLPMLTPNMLVYMVDILNEIAPAILEWISWLSPLALYQPCVGHLEQPWARCHGAFNRWIDEFVDPKSGFDKHSRAKAEYVFTMFIMTYIECFYELFTDLNTHCKEISRPRGQSARWAQDSYCSRWLKRLQSSAPSTPNPKEIAAVIKAQKEGKPPNPKTLSGVWPLSATINLECGWWSHLKTQKNFARESHKLAMQTYVEMGLVEEYRRSFLEKSEVGRALRVETYDFLEALIPDGSPAWRFPDGIKVVFDGRPQTPTPRSLVAHNRRHRTYLNDETKLAAVINQLFTLDIVKVTRSDKHVHPAVVGKVEELCEVIRQNYEMILTFEHEESLTGPSKPLSFSTWIPPATPAFPLQPFKIKKPLTWQFENKPLPAPPVPVAATDNNTQANLPANAPNAPEMEIECQTEQGGDTRSKGSGDVGMSRPARTQNSDTHSGEEQATLAA